MRLNEKDLRRFWAKVERRGDDECWLWRGSTTPRKGGYGLLGLNGKLERANRISYVLHHGDIPDGMLVCHKCDNPSCVNPCHLFVGTDADNVSDMRAKSRHKNPPLRVGEKHLMARLTREDVETIRYEFKNGIANQPQLAERFGVQQNHISRIIHGVRWAK